MIARLELAWKAKARFLFTRHSILNKTLDSQAKEAFLRETLRPNKLLSSKSSTPQLLF